MFVSIGEELGMAVTRAVISLRKVDHFGTCYPTLVIETIFTVKEWLLLISVAIMALEHPFSK